MTSGTTIRTSTASLVAMSLIALTGTVRAQTVQQVLDSVYINGVTRAAEMPFADSTQRSPLPEYIDRGIGGSSLRGCTLTAIHGLYCLDIRSDGKFIVNWPNPAKVEYSTSMPPHVPSYDIINCNDIPGLDSRKDETCTTFTVDLGGSIWLGGKDKGKSYSLVEAIEVPVADTCPGGYGALPVLSSNGKRYCSRMVSSGRPLLVDIYPIDGDVAEQFTLFGSGPLSGNLMLEERKTATFAQSDGTTIEIASGKRDWGLIGSELLQGITLLQKAGDTAADTRNYVLVTTTLGRVLAYDTAGGHPAFPVFDIPAHREAATPCSADAPAFSVRTGTKTGFIYAGDSQYCEVSALEPAYDADGNLTNLVDAVEGGQNLTLSTRSDGDYIAPTNITVSPGVSINLNDCADPYMPCTLVVNSTGSPIATLSNVQLYDTGISGMTLFQIENIPDCRYVPGDCLAELDIPDNGSGAVETLISAGVIVPLKPLDPVARLNPAAQRLNLTKLLPAEVTELFDEPLPDMLLSRMYRGQKINDFRFGGFFGRTEDGVVFRNVFYGEFDISGLAGSSLGCAENLGSLDWDVLTTVSERYVSASQPYAATDPQHLTTIINSGCGTSRTAGSRWSLKPYNLEMTPCTYNPDPADNWAGDGQCVVGHPEEEVADDAVYGKLLLELLDEFGGTLEQLACTDSYNENGGTAPLSATDCSAVRADYLNTLDKFDKCWDATQQPKQSSGNQTCQAFDVQLASLESTVSGLTSIGPDVANRAGELWARVITIRHVYDTRFTPSLPPDGFVEPQALPTP